MREQFFIGELAKRAGTTAKTIRYYEELGLLSAAARAESGYRLYGGADVERVRFIQSAKALGLSLAEIQEIVGMLESGDRPCGYVSARLEEKLTELDRRIAELVAFRDELRHYKHEVDAQAAQDAEACAHIAGVATGRFHLPAAPESALRPHRGA